MIKIITGHKLLTIAENVIKSIGDNRLDLSCDNIIVVPDRFSLIAEKLVFKALNIKATFNIHVMGITTLARKIISSANLECVYCDSQESKFLLFRALQKCKDNFLCFSKHLSQGLCQKIQNALSLIRSSGVEAKDLKENAMSLEASSQKKLLDLALILETYETMLNGKLDGNQTLKLFTSLIESKVNLSDTNFYFCGFDAFTKQGYEIIKNVSKTCKSLTVGAFKPTKNKNSSIFDVEMYNNLVSIFKDNNLEFAEEEVFDVFSLAQKQIFDNVYGYNIKPGQNLNYAKIFEMSSAREEIELVAKKILELTKLKKAKYKDISVATCESYFDEIENVFTSYGINFYIDKSKELSSTQVANFLKYALDLCVQNVDKESLINFVNNYFVELNVDKNDIENYIYENNIEYKKAEKLKEEYAEEELSYIINFATSIEENQTIGYYVNKITELLDVYKIEEKLNLLCEKFVQKGDMLNQKSHLQIFDKLTELNNKLTQNLNDEQISLTDFYELYFNALADIKVSQVPLSVDSVYVGDTSASFFEKVNYMFILGANQDVVPNVIKDLGLISDSEIDQTKTSLNLAPTVKMINRRNKFKLFDILTSATNNLFITYKVQDQEGKKQLVSQFAEDIFVLNNKQNKFSQNELYEHFVDDSINKVMFNSPTVNLALNNVSVFNPDSALIKKALNKLGEYKNFEPNQKEIVASGENMLNSQTTKISQIEAYQTCPFSHFVKYGLKLTERKTSKIEANDFGNFLHEFAKVFGDKFKTKLGTLSTKIIEKESKDIFNYLVLQKSYKKINDEDNDVQKQILLSEVIRFAKFLNYEQSKTDFKLYKNEFKFTDQTPIKAINNKQYTIVGIVDRIDKYDNNFRIIDYKTGSAQVNNSKIDNLYYGTKIQVYVYLKSISKNLNLNPFGAFYLPISNAYSGDTEKDYKLHGYFLGDINLVQKADNSLNETHTKSRFFEAELSLASLKKGEKVLTRSKDLTIEELESMMNYSVKVVENAINEILEGNILASPFCDACNVCKFASICGIENSSNEKRKNEQKVTPQTFLEIKYE